jgi:hypothetical protein
MPNEDLPPDLLVFLESLVGRELPVEFLELLRSVQGKRPKTVIDHILKYGYLTTVELEEIYGYKHPPRAARDVRELGIPLQTRRAQTKTGKNIAVYYFGDPSEIRADILHGRKVFPKKLKKSLIEVNGQRCSICLEEYEARYLQIDHRIPFHVLGDMISGPRNSEEYMLLCGSCNRAKSWSCEHCRNWLEKSPEICQTCYWANLETYKHVALRLIQRLDIVWTEDEVEIFEKIKSRAASINEPVPQYVKDVLSRHIEQTE